MAIRAQRLPVGQKMSKRTNITRCCRWIWETWMPQTSQNRGICDSVLLWSWEHRQEKNHLHMTDANDWVEGIWNTGCTSVATMQYGGGGGGGGDSTTMNNELHVFNWKPVTHYSIHHSVLPALSFQVAYGQVAYYMKPCVKLRHSCNRVRSSI